MKKILQPYLYLFTVHVAALVGMTLLRVVFYLSMKSVASPDAAASAGYVAEAFVRGVWFDNVIGCYILAPALLLTWGFTVAGGRREGALYRAVNVWCGVLYTLVFMACAANIPYFAYCSKPLNASIWNWAEYGTQTLGMIFGEPAWWGYIALFAVATAGFGLLLRWLRRRFTKGMVAGAVPLRRPTWRMRGVAAGVGLLLAAGCMLGIRGRLGYNPIKVSAAYFCNDVVLNNMGVNPVFSLLYSTLDDLRPENRTLSLMPATDAVGMVQQWLGRKGMDGLSPIARRVTPEGRPTGQNVVVVLMESMSAKLTGSFGGKAGLTPCIDSLAAASLCFPNFYSAGIHTNHGIYATLYGFPAIMFRNAMKGSNVPRYAGLPTVLHDNGYATMFFMTHESQYDNMNAFLRTNGYAEIYAQENYPADKVVNHFGVPDDFLFSYALPVMRERARTGHPFFATLLTISNHPPYVVPEEFALPELKPEEQIVRYADRCIGRFMEAAAHEPWFENTLFVFLADHGKLVGQADSELPESYNHVPCFIYRPGVSPQRIDGFALQEDVGPTVLGLLRIPYVQNNFGVDLLRESREAVFYTADKTIAARDSSHLYVFNAESGSEYCYRLDAAGRPVAVAPDSRFDWLKRHAFSQLQSAEYMVGKGMTTDRPSPRL